MLAQHLLNQQVMGVVRSSIIVDGKVANIAIQLTPSHADSAGVVQAWLPYTCCVSRCCKSKCQHRNNHLQGRCIRVDFLSGAEVEYPSRGTIHQAGMVAIHLLCQQVL